MGRDTVFRIVRGHADDTEYAAVVAVLLAVSRRAAAPARPRRDPCGLGPEPARPVPARGVMAVLTRARPGTVRGPAAAAADPGAAGAPPRTIERPVNGAETISE